MDIGLGLDAQVLLSDDTVHVAKEVHDARFRIINGDRAAGTVMIEAYVYPPVGSSQTGRVVGIPDDGF